MTQPENSEPIFLGAFLCEKVLVEQDGVKSAIRIIDRVTRTAVGPNPPGEMEPFDYEAALLIRLKSGWARGTYPVSIRVVKPSQEARAPIPQNVFFEGEEDRGHDIIVNVRLRVEMVGIYWFQVSLGDRLLTRVPLRIIYLPQVMPAGGPGGGQPPAPNPPSS